MSWPWSELGLDGPASLEEVRRAYAQRVKEVHPEEDPEGFQRLHTAYQQARQAARRAKRAEQAEGAPIHEEESRPPASPEPGPREADRLDVAQLLGQEQREAPSRRKQPETPELDVAELLRQEQREARPRPRPQQPQEPELDFDALLQQEEKKERAEAEARKKTGQRPWDFQRIFQEEDKRRTEQTQSGGGPDVPVSRALELVEMLFEEERSHRDWERFLTSVVFFRVKWNPRFMAALAGAFQAEPVLEPQIREAVCGAYGFQSGQVPREHQAFYEAVSGRKAQPVKEKKARFRQRHPFLFLLALVMCIVLALLGAARLGIYLYERPDREMVRELCQYIQEDYGYPVESRYAGYLTSPKLFYLPVQRMSFTAWPEGERDLARGEAGYGTDLGNRILTETLEAFAEEWGEQCDLEMTDEEGGYVGTGQMPAVYRISTAIKGGSECLTALAEELERLSQEPWYRLWTPTFQIRMEVWNAPYYTYQSSDGPFPVEEILVRYQEEVPAELVASLVEECGLAELDFEGRAYHIEDLGAITLHEDDYVLMGGVEEETGQTTRLYLYNNMYLISTPAEGFDPNMGSLEYAWLRMGERIPEPGDDLPWPAIGIYRD